jgi:Fe-S-cluster-containing hydrogenase component 2
MLELTGIATPEQVREVFPSIERINRGPVAVIECYQEIPCNPCYMSCRFGAISDLTQINKIPEVYEKKCTGCGVCVFNCPGLAIMIVDGSYSKDHILFKIPYEFTPLPEAGQIVKGLDRSGQYITDVEIVKVQNSKAMDRTPVVHVLVDRKFLYDFKNIEIGDK